MDDYNKEYSNPMDDFIALSNTVNSSSENYNEDGSGESSGATSARGTGNSGGDGKGKSSDGFGGSGDDTNNYRSDYDRPMKKSHKGLLIFLCILVIAAIAVGGFFIYQHFFKSQTAGVDHPYVAQLNVVGTIEETASSSITDFYKTQTYNQSYLINTITALENDKLCKGIVVYLNTPGGSAFATDEVYLKLMEFKKKTKKPVYAIMGPTCASGGYYIACAADTIFANRNTTTGSIGVTFGTMFDLSGFLEKYGIDTNTITSGPNKSMGSQYIPMTEEQKQIYQSIIDEAYLQFTGIVAESRNLNNDELWAVADGRIFTAKQALELKLIDQIANQQDALALIKKETGVTTICNFAYVKRFKIKDLFFALASGLTARDEGDLSAAIKLAEESYSEPYYIMN